MSTPASIARHPIHPMLIVFPITFFVLAPILDVVHAATGNPAWARIAFWDIVLGIATALVAAVPGFIDYLSLRGPAARLATWHLALNLLVVAIFAANLFMRGDAVRGWGGDAGRWLPLALSVVGAVVLAVSGWLGGHMVYVHGVGVTREGRDDLAQRRRAA
jgi:uncharacterized membrane protein